MQTGAWRQPAETRRRGEQETGRHEQIANMQHQHQAVTEGAVAGPAAKPHRLQYARERERQPGDHGIRQRHPQRQRDHAGRHRRGVEAVERRRQPAGIFPHQPVAGETRNDAAADQADQHDHHRGADADGKIGAALNMRFEMEAGIAGEQQRGQQHHRQIVPFAPGDDFAGDHHHHRGQERDIDQHRRQPAEIGGKGGGHPARKPQHHQSEQRAALQRQPSGPIGDRGEQEAGDHRRQIAIEHFMGVPVARRERGLQTELAFIERQPDQHRQRREQGAAEEERPKAARQHGRATMRLKTGNRTHD